MNDQRFSHRKTVYQKYMAGLNRTIKPRHRILNWVYSKPKLVHVALFVVLDRAMRATRFRLLRRLHPFVKPANNYVTNLPVNVDVQNEALPMPPAVLIELIKRAGYIHVLDKCLCRVGGFCKKHSHDIGCLMLGKTGFEAVPQFSRRISTDDAIAHVERALDNGLVPVIARSRIDNYVFLLKDTHTLIGVCFCCDCCCAFRFYNHVPEKQLNTVFPLLEGLQIEVNDQCVGCGACVKTCYMHAVSVEAGRARHSEICRGCGRCAGTCPHGAVEIRMTDPSYIDKTINHYLSIAKID